MSKQILMLVQFPKKQSPSQRFRCELYEATLMENGFHVVTQSFFDAQGYAVVHQRGHLLKKVFALIKGLIGRTGLLLELHRYDFIFIQREAAPIGPPVFEWLYAKLGHKKIIYDFDDAIWLPTVSPQNNIVGKWKQASKVERICQWSHKVSAGNEWLCAYARQFNHNVVYNPTCVDMDARLPWTVQHQVERIAIGWTGSFSTLKYLHLVEAALQQLQAKYDFDIKIICNQPPTLRLKNLTYIEWTEAAEVTALAGCQIGLMPLTNDAWSAGKCGFKLIQYLSLGMAAVASPVGVNNIIIEEGVNGYFATTTAQWYAAIEKLLLDTSLRQRMGAAGQQKIIAQYSLQSNKANFLSLFKS